MRLAALLLAGLLLAAGAQARPVTLTPEEMRELGFVQLTTGAPDKALAIAEQLLLRDPDDQVALVLKSRALRDSGHYREARKVAGEAWRQAETDTERYGAALAMAQALASQGHRTMAQYWLRRAVNDSPTPLAREIAVRDYEYVRDRNPLSFSLQFSIAPSSNINGGSSSTTTELLGLPFLISGDAQALSGLETNFGLTLRWRRPLTEAGQSEYRFSFFNQSYLLSADARAQAPEARGSDYDYTVVELGWNRRFTPAGPAAYGLGATVGYNWYGHNPLSLYLHLDASAERPLTRTLAGQIRVWGEQQWRQDNTINDALILGTGGRLVRGFGNGDRLGLSLGYRDTASDATDIANQAILGGIDWARGQPIGGVGVDAALGVERRVYPVFPFSSDGRQDLRLWASVSFTLEKVEYMGFSPVFTISGSKTQSTIDLYDTRVAGVTVGFRSAF